MKYVDVLRGLRLIKNKREITNHLLSLYKKRLVPYTLNNGIKFLVPNTKKNRSTILSINEIFNEEIYPVKKAKESKLILDIGAQAGIFSIYCLYKNNNTKVFSFEPDPDNFSQLGENIKINKLINKIIPINKALSGKNDRIEFYIHPESSRANSIYEKSGNKILVESITLEKAFSDLKIEKCDILKMDIEGAEYETFYNTPNKILEKINVIFIECHNIQIAKKDYTKEGMKKFLSDNGFKIIKDKGGILIAKNKR